MIPAAAFFDELEKLAISADYLKTVRTRALKRLGGTGKLSPAKRSQVQRLYREEANRRATGNVVKADRSTRALREQYSGLRRAARASGAKTERQIHTRAVKQLPRQKPTSPPVRLRPVQAKPSSAVRARTVVRPSGGSREADEAAKRRKAALAKRDRREPAWWSGRLWR